MQAEHPGWWLDEQATVGRENLDPAHVARYDEKEDAHAAAEVARLQAAGFGRRSTVVELGAGTGQFALAAAAAFGRVVAVDPSPVMLDRLRASAAGTALEIVEAGFLSYDHDGEPPDLVYSRYALHHLPDFWKAVALRRVRRLLRPGGTFRLWDIVFDAPLDQVEERIERWCASVPVDGDDGEWTRADLDEHVRDEHSTFTWLLEPMIEHAAFSIVERVTSAHGFDVQYVLVASPTNGDTDDR